MCTPEFREEFISLKRKSLGTATSTSNKMYMLRNSQVAVCRSGTPPRPISSPQQADPAGSNAACVPSWDGGQRVALGAGEAVSKHSQFGVPLNRKALFSTSSEVGSGKASWHPSTASSSTVLYRQSRYSTVHAATTISTSAHPCGNEFVYSLYRQMNSFSQVQYSELPVQVQQARSIGSSFEMRWTGELRSWRSMPDSEQSMFETAGGRPVQVSASVLARAHALLGEESGGDM
ncbi:unnamed protein product [Sphagnum jensenii]|uniref:Uncharacterized protein n=1 Tax=Sphagnum jensenii TaxID=128206 RepID=A0ABP0WFR2_9BRYO